MRNYTTEDLIADIWIFEHLKVKFDGITHFTKLYSEVHKTPICEEITVDDFKEILDDFVSKYGVPKLDQDPDTNKNITIYLYDNNNLDQWLKHASCDTPDAYQHILNKIDREKVFSILVFDNQEKSFTYFF